MLYNQLLSLPLGASPSLPWHAQGIMRPLVSILAAVAACPSLESPSALAFTAGAAVWALGVFALGALCITKYHRQRHADTFPVQVCACACVAAQPEWDRVLQWWRSWLFSRCC